MAMTAVKIPPTWKDDLVTLRDSLDADQGAEVVAAIAALASTETGQELLAQLGPLAEVLKANPKCTLESIAAVVEGECSTALLPASMIQGSPAPTARPARIEPAAPVAIGNAELPEPQTLMGRVVPYSLVGLLGRILDLAMDDPGRAREALLRTAKFL